MKAFKYSLLAILLFCGTNVFSQTVILINIGLTYPPYPVIRVL